ncbi:MAG TPA: cellulase family glycosylhydrolase, partial [Rhizobiaceae bacterium]|nr:cellulase family glycosylhydrolase [Rhizobiaceae bacterium]
MRLPFKPFVLFAFLLLAPGLAFAASFEGRRGIGMNLWETWPQESEWGDGSKLFPFPEWRRHVGVHELRSLKADGFDFIRMTIDPAVLLSVKARSHVGEMLEDVREAADLAVEAGLGVIVNLHTIPSGSVRSVGTGEIIGDEAVFERYLVLVRDIGRVLYGVDPAKVALEPFNEPIAACAGDEAALWAKRQKAVFAAARASATRLTLVLTGACWGSAEGLAALDPAEFPDDNLLWSFHSYAPFILTHQGAGWTGDIMPFVTGLPYPPHGANAGKRDAALAAIRNRVRAEAPFMRRNGILGFIDNEMAAIDAKEKLAANMAAPFEAVRAWAAQHGIDSGDILLGEFGMIRQEWQNPFTVPAAERAAYYSDMIALAGKHGFRWSMWSYSG